MPTFQLAKQIRLFFVDDPALKVIPAYTVLT